MEMAYYSILEQLTGPGKTLIVSEFELKQK